MSSPVQESDCNTSPAPDPGPPEDDPSIVTSDSDCSESDKSVEDTGRSTFLLKMLNFCKELAIMVLVAVAYAALTNENPPKVTKSPAAYPFFPRDSLVTDWYKGQITEAIEDARASDIAFVMFYAPWDAESQNARKEVEVAARYMADKVTFAAVNCWQPGSECKRQYSKVYKWPVLIAYPTHGRGIQYNGPMEAFHMVRFLQNVCQAVVRPEKVDDLIGKHNIVVSAYLDALPGSFDYAVFYSTALRFLERDPFRDTIFAVLPRKSDTEAFIELHSWNGTLVYEGDWTPDALTSWILQNSHYLTGWVSPTGMKSLTLAGFMQPGPTLMLFTPKNPLVRETDYYDMLREVAYEYYNCANESYTAGRLKLVKENRERNKNRYRNMRQRCLHPPKHVITNIPNVWTNNSIDTGICNCAPPTTTPTDKFAPIQLQKSANEEACRSFLLAEKYAPPIFEKGDTHNGVNVTGLACASNATLRFVGLDSLRFFQLAERLGLDLTRAWDRSGAVIVNEKMETHHIMIANLTTGNLREFVSNFTQMSLERSLRSKVYIETNTQHAYPIGGCSNDGDFCVLELTSSDFLSVILRKNKVVVVFYYSKQCGFCNGIGYMFLTLAKLLAELDDVIFARIDGDLNLLPWEYTMESYPTILLLPANGKSESRTFPRNIPITVPNLFGFVLNNVEPALRLKTMWAFCRQSHFEEEKDSCLATLRMETLSVIGKTLKEWRISSRKQKVLYKLQVLRHLHLLFAHTPDDSVKIRSFLKKIRG